MSTDQATPLNTAAVMYHLGGIEYSLDAIADNARELSAKSDCWRSRHTLAMIEDARAELARLKARCDAAREITR